MKESYSRDTYISKLSSEKEKKTEITVLIKMKIDPMCPGIV